MFLIKQFHILLLNALLCNFFSLSKDSKTSLKRNSGAKILTLLPVIPTFQTLVKLVNCLKNGS